MSDDYIRVAGFWVRRAMLDQDMVIVDAVYYRDEYQTHHFQSQGRELVIDVGAHIGCFARKWREKNPDAIIVCVEPIASNVELLRRNTEGDRKTIVLSGIVSYRSEGAHMASSVFAASRNTGQSYVLYGDARPVNEATHQREERQVPKYTLEDIMAMPCLHGEFDRIRLLKLDCEGGEYDILRHTPSLHATDAIIGEYHGKKEWHELRPTLFADWDYGIMSEHKDDCGIFHLAQRNRR